MSKPVDFKDLKHNRPNYYLVCPKNIRSNDCELAPVFKTDANKLYQATLSIIQQMPRTEIIYQDDQKFQLVCIQKTRIFRFPDYVDVQIFPIDMSSSTIGIFSRAKYGYYDFRVNKRRIVNIITQISDRIGKKE